MLCTSSASSSSSSIHRMNLRLRTHSREHSLFPSEFLLMEFLVFYALIPRRLGCFLFISFAVGHEWRIGRVDAFHPRGHGFDSRSSRHVRTLDKSFTHSYLWRFGVKFRHSIRAVSGGPLSSRGLEEAL